MNWFECLKYSPELRRLGEGAHKLKEEDLKELWDASNTVNDVVTAPYKMILGMV